MAAEAPRPVRDPAFCHCCAVATPFTHGLTSTLRCALNLAACKQKLDKFDEDTGVQCTRATQYSKLSML